MRKLIGLALPLVILFTIFSCKSKTASSETRLLRFNLEKGKTYDYEMVMDMDQEVMGRNNKIGVITAYVVNVTGDDGNIKTLDIEYKDFKMNMDMMGQQINIDASKRSEQGKPESGSKDLLAVMSNAFSGILGKKFTMKVDYNGKIQSVEGADAFIRSIIDSIKGDEQMKGMMMASLRDQFSAEKVKETFAPMFSVYPNKEIKVGDKWESSYVLSSQSVRCNTEYTVKSFEADKVIIDSKTKMEPEGAVQNPALGGVKLGGTQTGVMTLIAKSGLVVDAELNQSMETSGTIKIKMIGKTKMRGKERPN